MCEELTLGLSVKLRKNIQRQSGHVRLQTRFTSLRPVVFTVKVFQWYLEESAVGLQCTGEVVRVGATQAVAAAGGSSLLAVSAA